MNRYSSFQQVEQEHIKAMGTTLGPIYHALHNEVVWLHAKWLEYRKLYGTSEKRVELLNATAAFFFGVVQDVLWKDILLHIARLTDPLKHGKCENLTIRRLPNNVEDDVLAGELRGLIEEGSDRFTFAREWRNKRLAHNDLTHAIDASATTLPAVSRQNVEDALDSLRQIMNCVHSRYLQSDYVFDHFFVSEDAEALLCSLAVSERVEDRRRERLQQGKPLPEDYERHPEF